MKRRILCALMLIVFVITSFAVMPVSASTFTDLEANSATEEAVTVLNKLGVINGYKEDDGTYTFKPTNNVTRAEFTAMLLRTRGMGNVGSTSLENPPFPDVTDPSVSWAIANIRTARDLKIVNGYEDGTFRPNNTVSYEEAIKMIVCALGYGEMGAETTGAAWYARYLSTATMLKFLDGAGGQIGAPATRATIAMMLYNCLEVNIAENNEITEKTILENDLKLIKNIGFIASNPEISLSSPDANLRADEVQITAPDKNGRLETLTYKVDNVEEYADMLGAQITFYYSEDRGLNTRNLIMAHVEKSVTVEVPAENIEVNDCNANTVAYYANENSTRITNLNIDDNSIVVYNGQLYGVDADYSTYAIYCADMGNAAIPLIGSMKFLDRNGDKKYDIVFVNSYDAYIASSVTSSTKTIVDNNLRKGLKDLNKIVIDPDDNSKVVKIVDKNGKSVAFSTIKTGSVVCVMASNPLNGGEQVVTAVVCNDTVSGTVKGVNSDGSIKIDSKTYKFSEYAPWVNQIAGTELTMSQPEMGDSGKFYLDMNGNVIGYDKTEQSTNQQYGYIMRAGIKREGLDENLVFNIITQTGSKTTYFGYNNTKVDGNTYGSYESLLTALAATANPSERGSYPDGTVFGDEDLSKENPYAISQLVKFTTKSNKGQVVIDEIIPITSNESSGSDVKADELKFYGGITAGDKVTYSASNNQLTLGTTKKININSATIIKVPNDRTVVDDYKKMKIGDFRNGALYRAEFYDVSSTNSAKVVLIYGDAGKVGEVNATSPVMVITDIVSEEDPSGEQAVRYRLYGYVGSTEVDYWGSTDSEPVIATLQPGDVVRLGTDDDGYYTVKEEHIIFSVADGYRNTAITQGGTNVYPKEEESSADKVAYRVLWGSAVQRDDELLILSTDKVLAGDETEDAIGNTETMKKSWFKNAKIYEFDTTGRDLEIVEYDSAENTDVIDGLDLYDGASRPAEVFIHMTSETAVKTVIIVVR